MNHEPTPSSERAPIPVICPERPDVAQNAYEHLKFGMANLHFPSWKLPQVQVVFRESPKDDKLLLGHVSVNGDRVVVVYDSRFATPEGEKELIASLKSKKGLDYPGMSQTLTHELAHINLWSMTRMDHQPAIRLLDEGWATLVPWAGKTDNIDLRTLAEQIKDRVKLGLQEEPEVYRRCLSLADPVTDTEGGLNEAEYNVGAALLLWAARGKDPQVMVELLRKSPQATVHDDERFEPAHLDSEVHAMAPEHASLVQRIDDLDKEALERESRKWEVKQFHAALLEVTGYTSIQEAQQAFQEWIGI